MSQWKGWCFALANEYAIQARKTLVYENAIRETGVLFEVDGTHYVYGATEYVGEPVKANASVELNRAHKKNMAECLECLGKGVELFDIRTRGHEDTEKGD